MSLPFVPLMVTQRLDGCGRFREASVDLEIALPGRGVSAQQGCDCAEKDGGQIKHRAHLSQSFPVHVSTPTPLYLAVETLSQVSGLVFSRTWTVSVVKWVSCTLGNQIFGTTRSLVAGLQTKIKKNKIRLPLEVTFCGHGHLSIWARCLSMVAVKMTFTPSDVFVLWPLHRPAVLHAALTAVAD